MVLPLGEPRRTIHKETGDGGGRGLRDGVAAQDQDPTRGTQVASQGGARGTSALALLPSFL